MEEEMVEIEEGKKKVDRAFERLASEAEIMMKETDETMATEEMQEDHEEKHITGGEMEVQNEEEAIRKRKHTERRGEEKEKQRRTMEAQGEKRKAEEQSMGGEDEQRNIFDAGTARDREINRLLSRALSGVDITEVYSPERVNQMARRMGLMAGMSMDLVNGWDFDSLRMRSKAEEYIDQKKPKLVIGSPMCTAFTALQHLNWGRSFEQDQRQM